MYLDNEHGWVVVDSWDSLSMQLEFGRYTITFASGKIAKLFAIDNNDDEVDNECDVSVDTETVEKVEEVVSFGLVPLQFCMPQAADSTVSFSASQGTP